MSLHFVREAPNLDHATRIASSGFVQPTSEALQLDVDVHLKEGQIVYSILEDDRLIGFAIFNTFILPAVIQSNGETWCGADYLDLPILYLAGIILHESVQGLGIAEQVVQHVRHDTGISHFAFRTQSLRMWCAGNKMTDAWFPNPENTFEGYFHQAKILLAKQLKMDCNLHTFSAPGFYGAPLYGAKPTHHDKDLQAWWDSICSFERGDAMLCIGKFKS